MAFEGRPHQHANPTGLVGVRCSPSAAGRRLGILACMNTQTYTQRAQARPRPRIAVVTMGVKLGDETRGYTRFRVLSEMLVEQGFDVDLITSSFQHWEKAQRDTSKTCYQGLPYNVVFIDEPGYTRNLDLQRIRSHHVAAKNLRERFERTAGRYSLIYSEIPPNDVARVCAEYASEHNIPYVADINDLWPEAMRMVVNIPVLSDVAFCPFARDAKRVYQLLSGAVGTSDEYTARPAKDRTTPYPHATVYVGNDLAAFDEGAREHMADVVKPAGELWAVYAGTLGASYDLSTLVQAAKLAEPQVSGLRVKILGDGPDRDKLTELASSIGAPVDFLGYTPYDRMAAWLAASDITVNSLVHGAAQSIVTKIGDYLAAGIPIINTGESPEFCSKVEADGFGVNVAPGNASELTQAIVKLAAHPSSRKIMGAKAIVELIRNLL